MFAGTRAGKKKKSLTEGARKTTSKLPAQRVGSLTLKAKSRIVKLIGITIFALFWNGIVSLFLFSDTGVSGSLFMSPFVLIGLGAIAWTVYCFLALFNPRPVLTINPGHIPSARPSNSRGRCAAQYIALARSRLRWRVVSRPATHGERIP